MFMYTYISFNQNLIFIMISSYTCTSTSNYLTLIPNSTKFAKFCNAFAISFKVRQATSDGVSERNGKNIQMYLSVSVDEHLIKKWYTNNKHDTKDSYTCD